MRNYRTYQMMKWKSKRVMKLLIWIYTVCHVFMGTNSDMLLKIRLISLLMSVWSAAFRNYFVFREKKLGERLACFLWRVLSNRHCETEATAQQLVSVNSWSCMKQFPIREIYNLFNPFFLMPLFFNYCLFTRISLILFHLRSACAL